VLIQHYIIHAEIAKKFTQRSPSNPHKDYQGISVLSLRYPLRTLRVVYALSTFQAFSALLSTQRSQRNSRKERRAIRAKIAKVCLYFLCVTLCALCVLFVHFQLSVLIQYYIFHAKVAKKFTQRTPSNLGKDYQGISVLSLRYPLCPLRVVCALSTFCANSILYFPREGRKEIHAKNAEQSAQRLPGYLCTFSALPSVHFANCLCTFNISGFFSIIIHAEIAKKFTQRSPSNPRKDYQGISVLSLRYPLRTLRIVCALSTFQAFSAL
jgi:hypothetical protein